MEHIGNFVTAALLAMFLQNSIFERALGINILLYASRQKSNVIGFTLGLCYIMTLSSAASWCLDNYLGGYKYYPLLAPVLYVLVIGIIYTASLIVIWRYFPKLFKQIKKFVHLTVFNCAVLGALFLNSQIGEGIFSYIGYGLGTAVGFFAAGYLLYVAHDRLNSELVPAVFRGMPIMLIYVGILAMALHAFTGYVI
jgi:electron transport complex protein RnfA